MSDVRDALKVARREVNARLRSKAFVISTGLVLVALLGVMIVVTLIGDDDPQRGIGYIGQGQQVAEAAAAMAPQFGVDLELEAVADRGEAERRLDPAGQADEAAPLDVVIDDDRRALVHQALPADLEGLLTGALRTVAMADVLAEVELTAEQQAQLLTPPEVAVEPIDPAAEPEMGPAMFIAALAMFTLFGLLFFYGNYVSQGIVEEKASRVIELLLSTVRPSAVLYGKIGGLTLLGIAQSVLIAAVGLVGARVILDFAVPSEAWATLAVVLAWYVLGFVLYATLFAAGASLVSRQEDLGATTAPSAFLIFAAYFAAQFTFQNPDSTVSLVTSLVPFTAPLVQPLRFGAGVIAVWEVPLAIFACLATIAVLVPVAARFYAGGALRFGGRLSLREVWRSAER